MAKYDEDLHENLFFCTFRDKYSELFNLVANKRWIICIPRADIAVRMKISRIDIENHILIKEHSNENSCEGTEGSSFVSLNRKYLLIKGEMILTREGYKDAKQVKILFDEDFFNSNDQSYQILCIEQPLEGGFDDANSSLVASMETVNDCSTFLWNDTANSDKIKRVVDSYCASCRIPSSLLTLKGVHDIAKDIYEKALNEVGRLSHLRRMSSVSGKFFFQLATETYVLDKLYPLVFRSLCRLELGDKQLNGITRKFCDISLSDLKIDDDFKDNLTKANKHLRLLNIATCPLEKLSCFKDTLNSLAKALPATSIQQSSTLTADELLPMLVYLVLKAEIPNWKSNLHYIKNFHFSQVGNEELLYYQTSFEAAVEYVASGDLEKNLDENFRKPKLPDDSEMDMIERASHSLLKNLILTVIDGDLEALQSVVSTSQQLPDQITQQLCHPLCRCRKCLSIVQKYDHQNSRVTLFSKDLILRSPLHYAALSGHHDILQWLLDNTELRDDVDEMDINQQTPLHLAALMGNQKCLLYLLFKGAVVNKVDRVGDTPLHLACSHGHEECVKALLFHSTKCNLAAENNHGDTPLHLAARWGYVSIVSLLLEHNADSKLRNNMNETPQRATFDSKVYLMLRPMPFSTEEPEVLSRRPEDSLPMSSFKHRHSLIEQMDNASGIGGSRVTQRYKRRNTVSLDIKSETEKQIKKLFRAISDNDFVMVKYLLGWKESTDEPDCPEPPLQSADLCHPLCQCEKCSSLRKGRSVPLVTVNSCDAKGNTPLHKACLHGQRQIVKALLDHGAAMNVTNRDELLTPLHLACQYNHKDIVMILLENGANFNPCDKRGNTPLHFCCNNGHMDSATLLMIHGADVTIANNRGDTPLHNAARWNHASLVRELLLYGSIYSTSNKDNRTPLELTTDDEVHEIIKKAMNGEIATGQYAASQKYTYADSPGISDEEFEHV